MTAKLLTTARIVRPKAEHGVAWGAERVVLVRVTTPAHRIMCELWWHRSHTAYVSRDNPRAYFPAGLYVAAYAEIPGTTVPPQYKLHEGGRLSRALLACHREALATWFGARATELLLGMDLHHSTLVIRKAIR